MNNEKEIEENHITEREEVMLRDYYLRHAAPPPDVDAGLEAFEAEQFRRKASGINARVYRIVAGVAASVAVVMLSYIIYNKNAGDNPSMPSANAGKMMVYERAQDAVADITLTHGGKTTVVSGRVIDLSGTVPESAVTEMQTVSTPYNTTAEVTLSDGSEVTLNAGSRLTFPAYFSGGSRMVELHGEAYFKVTRDSARPFIVKAGKVQTRVLGTEFDVRAWAESDTGVSLVEGSVEVSTAAETRRLRICEQAVVTGGGALQVSDCDPAEVRAWTEGEFYFDNREMLDVAREIGQWYGVNVMFNSMEHAHTRVFFSAGRYDPLDEIIAIINSFDVVKMKKEGGMIVVD